MGLNWGWKSRVCQLESTPIVVANSTLLNITRSYLTNKFCVSTQFVGQRFRVMQKWTQQLPSWHEKHCVAHEKTMMSRSVHSMEPLQNQLVLHLGKPLMKAMIHQGIGSSRWVGPCLPPSLLYSRLLRAVHALYICEGAFIIYTKCQVCQQTQEQAQFL